LTAPAQRRGRPPAAGSGSTLITGVLVGTVVSFEPGALRVTHAQAGGRALVARVLASLDDALLAQATRERAEVALLFEGGDPGKPLVVGLVRSASPLVDALLASRLPPGDKVARVDGKRVQIEGKEEVVLRCGKASLTLRRDGNVVLRGVNLVTQADQVNKIRGGKVQLN